jgi:hypothetical protein
VGLCGSQSPHQAHRGCSGHQAFSCHEFTPSSKSVSPSGLILGTAYDIRQTRKATKREEFPFVARRQQ